MASFTQLTKRLQAVANFVRPGSFFVDVGCDHAYLPIALVKQGIIQKGVASDIHKAPLERAQKNIAANGLEEQIVTVLANGLQGIVPLGQTDVAIAGMGGDLIQNIIENAPWLCDPHHQLILQPMTKVEDLRRGLCEAGFVIKEEYPVEEGGHIYVVLSAFYEGEKRPCSQLYAYWGEALHSDAPAAGNYLKAQARRVLTIAKGKQRANKNAVASDEYFMLYSMMEEKLKELGYK